MLLRCWVAFAHGYRPIGLVDGYLCLALLRRSVIKVFGLWGVTILFASLHLVWLCVPVFAFHVHGIHISFRHSN